MHETKMALLAADDDPIIGLLLPAALEPYDFAVTVVDNGVAALDLALQQHFDVLLLDVEMPGMDGLQVAETLRSQGKSLPIVLATGRSDAEFLGRAAALAAVHLPKPIDWSSLGGRLLVLLAGV